MSGTDALRIDRGLLRRQLAILARTASATFSTIRPTFPSPRMRACWTGCELAEAVADAAEDEDGKCDCERPGFFHCGVAGILADLDNGKLARAPPSAAICATAIHPTKRRTRSWSNWESPRRSILLNRNRRYKRLLSLPRSAISPPALSMGRVSSPVQSVSLWLSSSCNLPERRFQSSPRSSPCPKRPLPCSVC